MALRPILEERAVSVHHSSFSSDESPLCLDEHLNNIKTGNLKAGPHNWTRGRKRHAALFSLLPFKFCTFFPSENESP